MSPEALATKETANRLEPSPPELWPAITKAWLAYRGMPGMEKPTPIALIVAAWHIDHGYSLDAIREALRMVTHPRHARNIQYGNQVVAELAKLMIPDPTADRFQQLVAQRDARKSGGSS